jgi:hypothetical protein
MELAKEHLMVHPLTKRERQAHHAENPDMRGYRVATALDRENQPDPRARERIVKGRASVAQLLAWSRGDNR